MRGTPQLEYVETFIHSKQLKSLEFFMKMDCSLENLLLLFLRSNPKLQLLKISFFNTIIVTNLFFQELISSSLKSLYVEDFISVEDPDTCASCFSIPNAVLRNVSLVTKRLNAAVIQRYFLQACPNLHHLRISYITHSDLQLIFKYQVMILSSCFSPIDYRITFSSFIYRYETRLLVFYSFKNQKEKNTNF